MMKFYGVRKYKCKFFDVYRVSVIMYHRIHNFHVVNFSANFIRENFSHYLELCIICRFYFDEKNCIDDMIGLVIRSNKQKKMSAFSNQSKLCSL